jgi:hypothetical protein
MSFWASLLSSDEEEGSSKSGDSGDSGSWWSSSDTSDSGSIGSALEAADLAGNLIGGIQGAKMGREQEQRGKDLRAEAAALSAQYERPEFNTPEAINLMMQGIQGRQYQNMPGYNIAQGQLGQSTAQGATAIGEMGAGAESIGAMANLYSNQMGAQSNLAMQNAQYRDKGQMEYLGALEGQAEWQQKEWEWNEADPYIQAQQKAAQLDMMGRQMEWGGVDTRMGSWQEALSGV